LSRGKKRRIYGRKVQQSGIFGGTVFNENSASRIETLYPRGEALGVVEKRNMAIDKGISGGHITLMPAQQCILSTGG